MKKLLVLVAVLLIGSIQYAAAQDQFPDPNEPIRLLNPYGAGGAVDITARILASVAPEYLDTRLDVVSMPGAGGQEAINFVADQQPDGHTLLITDYGPLITTALQEQVAYDLADWVAIVQITEVVPVFFVRSDSDIQTLEDWIVAAQEAPGSLSIGHGRHLSVPHLPLILFEQQANIENTHIPTTGGAEALAFVLGGQVDIGASVPSTIAGSVDAGDVIPLAVASAERVAALPDTPTLSELGYDVVLPAWYTVFAHVDVPEERRQVLEEKIIEALNSESAQALGARSGVEIETHRGEYSQTAYERTIENLEAILATVEE